VTTVLRAAKAALVATTLAASWISEVHAAEVSVVVSGCALRQDELERLVELELAAVVDRDTSASAYRVEVRCEGPEMELTLHDPLTSKTLRRTVRTPAPDQAEPERLTALTLAQLYRAAWLELSMPDPPPLAPSRPPASTAAARDRAAGIARDAMEEEGVDRDPIWSIAVLGGVRVRHLPAPVVLPAVALEGSWSPGVVPVWLGLQAGFERTTAARRTGSVGVDVLRAGAVVSGDVATSGPVALVAESTASIARIRIGADEVAAGFSGDEVDGAGFDGSVGLGGALGAGPLRVELVGRIGLLAATPAGRVAGDEPVDLDGGWAGGDLRVRLWP
jgi:hypothetical protein